ncbi:Lrp/AsnC family transcriptional regulator [Nocardioides insulae]|uniref:Lrp/AsnC family transcriptional regulator n=1 Tax=Nocardioides insulae TaxID=394734 RepID=UPI0009FC1829|nr:Lrp/AsnC family transcriptional regulator [Nocardioides insulae]
MDADTPLDQLDLALLEALYEQPRIGDLELSRVTRVARATVQSRLRRLRESGVIRDWAPTVDAAAAGFSVQAFVTLEISQGALDQVRRDLAAIPQVLEAHVTTGSADVLCRVATASHTQLQDVLVRIDQSAAVVRSTSVVALSVLIEPRVLDLLRTTDAGRAGTPRAPAYRALTRPGSGSREPTEPTGSAGSAG